MSGFAPTRLTLARHRRELTLRDLGDKVGCTAAAIGQFETGKRNPTQETLVRIALALDFPVAFFGGDDLDLLATTARADGPSSVASFRSLRSLSAKSQAKALAGGVLITQLAKVVGSRVRTPLLELPDVDGETPERAADIVRGAWRLGEGPIHNMVHLLESRGVKVFWMRNECHEVDAFSFWRDGSPFVILGNHKTPERSRRDAAHELAHLVLHRHGDVCGRQAEDEAERFASQFLLPAAQFMRECPIDPQKTTLSALKRRWAVSRASIVRRAFDLGMMTEWQYRSECISISQAGRTIEQDPIEREQSLVYSRVLPMFADAGIYLDDLAAELTVTVDEVLNYIPVENPERWRTAAPQARVLAWAPRSPSSARNADAPAGSQTKEVVKFEQFLRPDAPHGMKLISRR